MGEPPRKNEELLSKNMWKLLFFNAFLIGVGLFLIIQFTLAGLFPLNEWNLNPKLSFIPPDSTQQQLLEQKARTMLITTIFIIETTFVWSFRRPNKSFYKSIKEEFSFNLMFICLFTLGIHLLVINFSYYLNSVLYYVYHLDINLNLIFLSLQDWGTCILFSLPGIFGIELYKNHVRRKKVYF